MKQEFTKQVSKDAYAFTRYSGEDRWISYHTQLREILSSDPESVLEVGVGEGVVRDYLRSNTDIRYTSFDIADDLHPDVLGDVRSLPFPDNSFDVVCAFEVLEHLPFTDFEKALLELRRVSKKTVLVSLPHFGPPTRFLLKVPFVREMKFSFKIPYARKHVFGGQHYWEIGKRGYSINRIRHAMGKLFDIRKDFISFGNQYHHFFVLAHPVESHE